MSQQLVSLEMADDALRSLLDGISLALVHRCPVVIHTLWQAMPYTALLPFHLHLRWPERIAALPLNTNWTIIPFLHTDAALIQHPLYHTYDAHIARRQARSLRHTSGTFFEGKASDFVHPDWEEGLEKQGADFQQLTLPGSSFLAVDNVTQTGIVSRGHRPYLGSRATRKAPRPSVFVPARGILSADAYAILASTDFLLVNLQGIRGKQTIMHVQEILQRRGNHLPSLIITSSPSDLRAIGWDELQLRCRHYAINSFPASPDVTITLVGKDRPQAEKELDFAVREIQGYSPLVDQLTLLAQAAWWAGRQNIGQAQAENSIYQRFCSTLEQAHIDSPMEARLLTAAKALVTKTFQDNSLAEERLNAVIDAIFQVPSGKRTLVLTKQRDFVKQLERALSETIGITQEQFATAGILCGSTIGFVPTSSFEYVITCGYFGTSTIDAILASGATHVRMILDPIEACIARNHVRDMQRLLPQELSLQTCNALQSFASLLHQHILPFENTITLTIESNFSRAQSFLPFSSSYTQKKKENETILILFVDGTQLEVPRNARLEIVERQGAVRLRTVLASDLQPGDEFVLVADDVRSLFSEYLIKMLDDGQLRSLVEKRENWFAFLQAIKNATRPNLRSVHRNLAQRGVQASYQTVRLWAKLAPDAERTTPQSWKHFKAFAEELGITLPETYLLELFNSIRQLRTRHRLAGRTLVRAMRNAYFGRLDSQTLAQIEREWGLSARELVESTRLIEIDSIIA